MQQYTLAHAARRQRLTVNAKTSASYLTLRRLLPWLRPAMQRLRLLCAMAEAATLLKGGALITAIHGFAQHGDPSVAQFASAILAQAQRPLLDMIRVWLAEGRLEDPCGEFFIAAEEQAAAARRTAEAAAALHLRAQPGAWGLCGHVLLVWVFSS